MDKMVASLCSTNYAEPASTPVGRRITDRRVSQDGLVWTPLVALSKEQLFDLIYEQGEKLNLTRNICEPGEILAKQDKILGLKATPGEKDSIGE